MHKRAVHTTSTKPSIHVRERRAVFRAEVVPEAPVVAVQGVFDLVDIEVATVSRDFDYGYMVSDCMSCANMV